MLTLSELNMYTVAIWHYRGGHPVPRAKSLYDGNQHIFATIHADLGFFSLLFPLRSFQTIKRQGFCHRRPVKDSD
jgi:hypothetical protein